MMFSAKRGLAKFVVLLTSALLIYILVQIIKFIIGA